jgi:hypothetical protein
MRNPLNLRLLAHAKEAGGKERHREQKGTQGRCPGGRKAGSRTDRFQCAGDAVFFHSCLSEYIDINSLDRAVARKAPAHRSVNAGLEPRLGPSEAQGQEKGPEGKAKPVGWRSEAPTQRRGCGGLRAHRSYRVQPHDDGHHARLRPRHRQPPLRRPGVTEHGVCDIERCLSHRRLTRP